MYNTENQFRLGRFGY